MSLKIKLIWDFRGPEALKTAKHHEVHLKEFAQRENLHYHKMGVTELNPMYSYTYITVEETDMKIYRDALKPHRGELA